MVSGESNWHWLRGSGIEAEKEREHIRRRKRKKVANRLEKRSI